MEIILALHLKVLFVKLSLLLFARGGENSGPSLNYTQKIITKTGEKSCF